MLGPGIIHVSTYVSRDLAQEFREVAARRGKTISGMLRELFLGFLAWERTPSEVLARLVDALYQAAAAARGASSGRDAVAAHAAALTAYDQAARAGAVFLTLQRLAEIRLGLAPAAPASECSDPVRAAVEAMD